MIARDPWLASLLARRLTTLRERLDELRAWLTGSSRRMRRATARKWAVACSLAALLLALGMGTAQANTITVDVGAGGNCSLAEAIDNANDTTTGQPNTDCGDGDETGGDAIQFDLANTAYGYTAALPNITTEITIQGNGNTAIQRTGGPNFSVLSVTGGGSLALANATITGGSNPGGGGGGIFVKDGDLRVTDTTITGNTAFGGGGIYAGDATVSLTRVTISDNSAYAGGGLWVDAYVTATLTNTTISGNSAADAGGIEAVRADLLSLTSVTISGNSATNAGGAMFVVYGTTRLTNTTISGNTADRLGGGIHVALTSMSLTGTTISGNSADYGGGLSILAGGTVSVTNTTISGNLADMFGGGMFLAYGTVSLSHATVTGNSAGAGGGGVHINSADVDIENSIVAAQEAGTDCGGNPIVSGGYNIDSDSSCGFAGTGDQQGVTAAQLNLGPLASNPPGSTQTHALGPGSFALDKIPSGTNGCGTTITSDQRGATRPQNGACDVGAYEIQVAAPTAAQVTYFAAAPDPTGRIRIAWETASEVDVVGFRVERSSTAGGPWRGVGGLIPARGSTAGGAVYTMTDAPGVGRFAYRLEVVDADGTPQTHGPVEAIVRTLRAFLPVGWR